jgi:excisionase family DNA binding protein
MDLTILDVREAAERLRGSVHFVRTLIATGDLKFVKIGKKFCVTVGDLDRWVESNRRLRDEEVGESLGQGRARRVRSIG